MLDFVKFILVKKFSYALFYLILKFLNVFQLVKKKYCCYTTVTGMAKGSIIASFKIDY